MMVGLVSTKLRIGGLQHEILLSSHLFALYGCQSSFIQAESPSPQEKISPVSDPVEEKKSQGAGCSCRKNKPGSLERNGLHCLCQLLHHHVAHLFTKRYQTNFILFGYAYESV